MGHRARGQRPSVSREAGCRDAAALDSSTATPWAGSREYEASGARVTNELEQTEPREGPQGREGGMRPRADRGDRGDRADRGDRGDRGDRDDGPRRGFRRRGCEFCINKIEQVDYKDADRLRRYVGDRAKMEPRRKVGTCARHQRMVSRAVKRARFMALLPYTAEHIRLSGVRVGSGRSR